MGTGIGFSSDTNDLNTGFSSCTTNGFTIAGMGMGFDSGLDSGISIGFGLGSVPPNLDLCVMSDVDGFVMVAVVAVSVAVGVAPDIVPDVVPVLELVMILS